MELQTKTPDLISRNNIFSVEIFHQLLIVIIVNALNEKLLKCGSVHSSVLLRV